MKKYITIVFVLIASAQLLCAQSGRNQEFAEGRMFHYQSSSNLLYATYSDNASSLAWLDRLMFSNRVAVLSGQAHFEIFGYIPSYAVGDARSINKASIQGSVLRAYLKTQYGIPHSRVTFAIDTTQGLRDVVQLQLVAGDVPLYANSQISYTQSSSSYKINEAVHAYYNGVPYMSYAMHIAKRNPEVGDGGKLYALRDDNIREELTFDDFVSGASNWQLAQVSNLDIYVKTDEGEFVPATINDINDGIKVLYARTSDNIFELASIELIIAEARKAYGSLPENSYLESIDQNGVVSYGPYTLAEQTETQTPVVEAVELQEPQVTERPYFAMKTNILYWLVAAPNLELEFLIGDRFSIAAEGAIAHLTPLLKNHEVYEGWAASGEARVWLGEAKKFEGFYLGVYGSAGHYNYKFQSHGDKGHFYSFGLSAGYMLSLSKNFGMEFGLAGGFMHNSNMDYFYDGAAYVPIDPVTPIKHYNRFFPTKAKISLVWRF